MCASQAHWGDSVLINSITQIALILVIHDLGGTTDNIKAMVLAGCFLD